MAEPALWCEARCAGIYDESPVGCQETSPGKFGVKAAVKAARRAGWGVRKGEWFCPVCLRRRET